MRAFAFLITFAICFGLTYAFLAAVDSLPNPPEGEALEATHEPEQAPDTTSPELPVRVVQKDIGLDSKVLNPTSTDIDTLNKAVDEAAMRWPTSGRLGENGTVLLFGHSSHLPIVRNQAYKTFNSIEKLKKGQIVSVYSRAVEYRYSVTGVRLADATEDVVELPSDKKYLILVTCDNFGVKSDRYIVTADYVGAYSL
jgi:LPXTG-site transpeptidase (sortase) family protein